jgi:hypothetical protein
VFGPIQVMLISKNAVVLLVILIPLPRFPFAKSLWRRTRWTCWDGGRKEGG